MEKLPQCETSLKILEDSFTFYKALEEDRKGDLSTAATECTKFGDLFYITCTQIVDLWKERVVKDRVVRFIIQDSCTTFGPSFSGLVEPFRVGFIHSVRNVFLIGSIDSQFYADTTVDCITLCSTGGASSEDGGASTKGKDFLDPEGGTVNIEL